MSYAIQGPELEGERGTVEVPHAPKSCPLCSGAVDVSSEESGPRAWVYINCRRCRLQLMSTAFHIYYHCACDEFRNICQRLIEKWNHREPVVTLQRKWREELPKGNVSGKSGHGYIEEFLNDLHQLNT
jgi:hypothetical protein